MPVAALSVMLIAAHVFDFATFLFMTSRHGLAAELNPFVVFLAQDFGLPGVTLAKIGSVAFLAVMALVLRRVQHGRSAIVLLAVGVVAGLVGGFSNIASF
jgi:hypothetical protein